jgi:hypothetical protein
MTKEQVEKRLAELEAILEEQKMNASATMGAIQDCKYWLAQMAEEEKVKV